MTTDRAPIEFWFDFSCPYAYLASTQRRRLAAESGREVALRPFLLGGVFAALGQAQNLSATLSPPKARHNRNDVVRWASWFEVPIATPRIHPNRTVDALRALLACPPEAWSAMVDACFAAYWVHQRNLADRAVIADLVHGLGLDANAVIARSQGEAVKAELRVRTDAALAAGVFGAPAFVVDGELFWGQDRLPLVVAAAKGWQVRPELRLFQF
ncbi:MAG: 2-hydroxychromene-2-carboxylate isomerase [Deltaproteobacteria bacterium]|nr:2-hydroxychromene-2-carboxylate isomerase [Deltaproteobacteria bacterium]